MHHAHTVWTWCVLGRSGSLQNRDYLSFTNLSSGILHFFWPSKHWGYNIIPVIWPTIDRIFSLANAGLPEVQLFQYFQQIMFKYKKFQFFTPWGSLIEVHYLYLCQATTITCWCQEESCEGQEKEEDCEGGQDLVPVWIVIKFYWTLECTWQDVRILQIDE